MLSSALALPVTFLATVLVLLTATCTSLLALVLSLATLPFWMFVSRGPEQASEFVNASYKFGGAVVARLWSRLLVVMTGQSPPATYGNYKGTNWYASTVNGWATFAAVVAGILIIMGGLAVYLRLTPTLVLPPF